MKSYHSSSELLDQPDSDVFTDVTSASLDSDLRSQRPSRKTSYLTAVNAPSGRGMISILLFSEQELLILSHYNGAFGKPVTTIEFLYRRLKMT